MSGADLESGFGALDDGGGPPEGWQERVLARIAQAPVPRRRSLALLVAFASGATLSVAAAAVFFFATRREPAPTPASDTAGAQRIDRRIERLERELDEVSAAREQAFQRLLAAKTEEEKAMAQRSLEEARRRVDLLKVKAKDLRRGRPKRYDGAISVKCDPNDPLCAIE